MFLPDLGRQAIPRVEVCQKQLSSGRCARSNIQRFFYAKVFMQNLPVLIQKTSFLCKNDAKLLPVSTTFSGGKSASATPKIHHFRHKITAKPVKINGKIVQNKDNFGIKSAILKQKRTPELLHTEQFIIVNAELIILKTEFII